MSDSTSDWYKIYGASPFLHLEETSVGEFKIELDGDELRFVSKYPDTRIIVPQVGNITIKPGDGGGADIALVMDTGAKSGSIGVQQTSGDLVATSTANDVVMKPNSAETARFGSAGGLRFSQQSTAPATAADVGTFWVHGDISTAPTPRFRTESSGTDYSLVRGPTSAVTDNRIARWDGTTALLQSSGVTVDDSGNVVLETNGTSLFFGGSSSTTKLTGSGAAGGDLTVQAEDDLFLNSNTSGLLRFRGGGSDKATVDLSLGHLGLGSFVTPTLALEVRRSDTGTTVEDYVGEFINVASTETTHSVLRLAMVEATTESTDRFLTCFSDDNGTPTVEFFINGQGGTGTSFTGQHWVVYESSGRGAAMTDEVRPGMILECTGSTWARRNLEQGLPIVRRCTTRSSRAVYGVLSGDYASAYDFGIWREFDGSFNTACEAENGINPCKRPYESDSPYFKARVNALGDGQVWVTDASGPVSLGDYVVSSDILDESGLGGYGELQGDDLLRSSTVAKCTQAVDWEAVTDTFTFQGRAVKRALVACTYHCG